MFVWMEKLFCTKTALKSIIISKRYSHMGWPLFFDLKAVLERKFFTIHRGSP